jgi:hypothetical protein
MLFAAVTLSSLPQGRAGHGSGPAPPTPTAGVPLQYCRPLHLSAEPSEFRAGEVARRFRVFVEANCSHRSEPVIVEVWYRALYYDRAKRVAFGAPNLVRAVETRTELVEVHSDGRSDLNHFDVPATGWYLHLGCYVARVRIPALPELIGRTPSASVSEKVDQVGEVEACAVPPRPSLPGPSSESILRPRHG